MVRRIRKLAAWLSVLIVVLFLIHVLTFTLAWGGSGAGTGVFSYYFRARFQLDHESDNGRTMLGSVNVEGRVEPRFMMWGHVSPQYREAEMDWLLFGDGGNEGHAVVDLDHMQIAHDGHTVPLTAEHVCSLFGVSGSNDGEQALSSALVQFFQSARDGSLPLPNHHGHSLPDPLPGRMQHFAIGPAIRPLELFWVVAWSIAGLCQLFTRQRISVGKTQQA